MKNLLRLSRIAYLFPAAPQRARVFFESLTRLLGQVPGSRLEENWLTMYPTYPPGALPATLLLLTEQPSPAVVFDLPGPSHLAVGALRLLFEPSPQPPGAPGHMPEGVPSKEPGREAGLPAPSQVVGMQPLPVAELERLFSGHLLRLDHTGVEFPSNLVSRADWERLLECLASAANLYSYPSGEDWPFLLPATEGEFQAEIGSFAAPRGPKFELTYAYVPLPTLQFHADTNLLRGEVEARLPGPYGFALPGVETFRSVYLESPWPGLAVRVDLTFWEGGGLNDWDSGEWLVMGGRRIRGQSGET